MRWFFIKTQQNEMTLMVSIKFIISNAAECRSHLQLVEWHVNNGWQMLNLHKHVFGQVRHCSWKKTYTSIILLVMVHFITTHAHTQPFNGLLSGTTWVGRYQKKHSPTYFGRYPNFLKTQCHRSSDTKNWLDLFSCFDRTLIDLWRTDRET